MSDDEFLELCKFGSASEVEEALENGANINARDNEGMTALCIASDYEHAEVVEVLLKYGADVNAKDDYGYTALMYAACDRNSEDYSGEAKQAILEALLRHGADINAQNKESGSTALHLAVQNGCYESVKVLLKHRANVNIENDDGETPLDCVPYDSDWLDDKIIYGIEDALLNPKKYAPQTAPTPKPQPKPTPKRPAMSDWEFLELCESGRARAVEKALENGANVNAEEDRGVTALHLAAREGHADVAEVLLNHGANVNNMDWDAQTALHEAAYNGHADVVEVLLKHGANVNAHGVDMYPTGEDGPTALDLAKNPDVVKLLRAYGAE